jgi:hypothetical protein
MEENLPPQEPTEDQATEESNVSYPEQTLWRQFGESKTDEDFYYNWIRLQIQFISNVHSCIIVAGPPDTGPFTPVSFWPKEHREQHELAEVIERTLRERKGVVIRNTSAEVPASVDFFHIAYPIKAHDMLCGAVAFQIAPCPSDELQAIMRQLQWGVAWLENRVLRKDAEQERAFKQRITTVLDLAAGALQDRFQAATTSFVTLLATRLNCDRVSIGFVKGGHVKVSALSHSAQFKKQMNLIRSINEAMNESVDQHSVIVYPKYDTADYILRSHEELARQHGNDSICTIPFFDKDGKGYGALTLERSEKQPFDSETAELCDNIAALVAPILEEKRRNDKLLIKKIGESVQLQAEKLVGPGHVLLKISLAVVLLLVIFFSFAKGDYRVTAKTTIEGAIQRAIVAPFDGYIFEQFARAGDTVNQGGMLCTLDSRDIHLQRVALESQKEQAFRKYREAMASSNRANMKIFREQMNQAEAQLELIRDQILRTKLTAPFDAVVVSGDLSQSLGSPVQRGQILFKVAPLHDYRLKLQVDERDIGEVKAEQSGALILNSLPNMKFPFTIEKITPVSSTKEGENYFLVEAKLGQVSERLRPGMEGFSKVDVGRRKLIWVWTHDLIDWVKLWVWSWWP